MPWARPRGVDAPGRKRRDARASRGPFPRAGPLVEEEERAEEELRRGVPAADPVAHVVGEVDVDLAGRWRAERLQELRELLGALALELLDEVAEDRALADAREAVVGEVDRGAGVQRHHVEAEHPLDRFGPHGRAPTALR